MPTRWVVSERGCLAGFDQTLQEPEPFAGGCSEGAPFCSRWYLLQEHDFGAAIGRRLSQFERVAFQAKVLQQGRSLDGLTNLFDWYVDGDGSPDRGSIHGVLSMLTSSTFLVLHRACPDPAMA